MGGDDSGGGKGETARMGSSFLERERRGALIEGRTLLAVMGVGRVVLLDPFSRLTNAECKF